MRIWLSAQNAINSLIPNELPSQLRSRQPQCDTPLLTISGAHAFEMLTAKCNIRFHSELHNHAERTTAPNAYGWLNGFAC